MQRPRHQEFVRFLNAVEREVAADKAVHVVLDNYATHKHPKVTAWLTRHQRFTFHFTPTSCSWANAVEGLFAKLTRQPAQARRLHLDCRASGRHQPLHRRNQQQAQAVRLDQIRRRHPRCRAAREASVRSDPLDALMAGALRAQVNEAKGLEIDAIGDPVKHAGPVAVDATPHHLAH